MGKMESLQIHVLIYVHSHIVVMVYLKQLMDSERLNSVMMAI